MNYLLDSNTVSDFYNRTSPQYGIMRKRIADLTDQDNVYISVLTLYEMEYGYSNAPAEKKTAIKQQIQFMCDEMELLPLAKEAALTFGALKKAIQNSGMLSSRNIKQHSVDIMVAANAIFLNCIVVSEDKLFTELAELDSRLLVENWLK